MAKNLPEASVFAIDVSSKALEIAKINASNNSVKISFIQKDILKEKMQKNVLDYEPELALFVKNEKPLIFYEAVARFAKQNLSEKGKLYFEINERFGNEVKELLLSSGFRSVEIMKDINGKDRIITAEKL